VFAVLFLAALPPSDGSIAAAFDRAAMKPPARGSDAYVAPDEETREAIGDAIRGVLAGGDPVPALERGALAGYEVCGEEEVVLFRPVKAGLGQPVFAIRTGVASPLIVEVPHTAFDYGTLEQGRRIFEELGARALIAAGVHRYASPRASPCDGATGEADMAHATDTVFHRAHELLAEHYAGDYVVSLHGMGGRGVIVSDGTGVQTSSSAASRLVGELGGLLAEEKVAGCRAPSELCGTTNAQGRHVNGSEDACRENAPGSSGRFIHLEQSPAVRKNPAPVIEALRRVLR
jgi:hypothetical protein